MLNPQIPETIRRAAENVLHNHKVAVFIVTYNAVRHIEQTISRIPDWIREKLAELFVIDDSSSDATFAVLQTLRAARYPELSIFTTPVNQGYGGNQKLGYAYALEQGHDIVVLLHGDGQYAPEYLPFIIAEYAAPQVDAVYGSRFLEDPLKGSRGGRGMPVYKWLGNRILTTFGNIVIGTRMSEMHSGYRSYALRSLRDIPFHANDNGFSFDADIIIQLQAAGRHIKEIPIPTFYGDEICHVNGIKYAWQCMKAALKYRCMQFEVFYDPKYDIPTHARKYSVKKAPGTLHVFMRDVRLNPADAVLHLGAGDGGAVAAAHAARGNRVVVVADEDSPPAEGVTKVPADLNGSWETHFTPQSFEVVFALDVIEHLSTPETALDTIHRLMKNGGKLYISTGNIGFWPLRLMHLFGAFNYGRRGILDKTHTRLFTRYSFRRILENAGFAVTHARYFGPPIADIAEDSGFLRLLHHAGTRMARLWPGGGAFQMLFVCTRIDSLQELKRQVMAGAPAPAELAGTG